MAKILENYWWYCAYGSGDYGFLWDF